VSVNRFLPHILVLPEDDANRQLANGFLRDVSTSQIQVLPEAGGWTIVRDRFSSYYVAQMRQYEQRFMVLLIDFDGNVDRLESLRTVIPKDLFDRVFVLGALSEPEALRQASLGSYETIGKAMAGDCRNGTHAIWSHQLLNHNSGELSRLGHALHDILFVP
jgi:hypothetical protein